LTRLPIEPRKLQLFQFADRVFWNIPTASEEFESHPFRHETAHK
jgi:hypothetical protein